MMLSVEDFYENNLKGKEKEEIFNEIVKLKKQISTLKLGIEDPRYQFFTASLGYDNQIVTNREFLNKAIESYIEAGGDYTLSKDEKKATDFENSLYFVKRIKLEYEKEYYTISLDNISIEERRKKNIEVLYKGKNHLVESVSDCSDNYFLTHYILLCEIKKIFIGEWQDIYNINRFSITPEKIQH